MKAVEFDEVNVRFAEHQEEYETLPGFSNVQEGTSLFCFELDEFEKKKVAETGRIWFKVLTFNKPLQPIALSTLKDQLYTPLK